MRKLSVTLPGWLNDKCIQVVICTTYRPPSVSVLSCRSSPFVRVSVSYFGARWKRLRKVLTLSITLGYCMCSKTVDERAIAADVTTLRYVALRQTAVNTENEACVLRMCVLIKCMCRSNRTNRGLDWSLAARLMWRASVGVVCLTTDQFGLDRLPNMCMCMLSSTKQPHQIYTTITKNTWFAHISIISGRQLDDVETVHEILVAFYWLALDSKLIADLIERFMFHPYWCHNISCLDLFARNKHTHCILTREMT